MSFGILGNASGQRTLGALGGFGAIASTIPAHCWDQPGFKDAHAAAYKKAQAQCSPSYYPYASEEQCVVTFADAYAKPACGAGSGSSSNSAGFTWKNTDPNPAVKAMQIEINKVLAKNGYAAIGADGKLGPGTCGGARVADKHGGKFLSTYGLTSICQSYSEPTKMLSAPSSTVTTLEELEPSSSGSLIAGVSNKNLFLIVAACAAGAYYLSTQPKKKAA